MQKTYTVADLAEVLDVPRTTVNDWLKSYAAYCDADSSGRRKVYLESTLEVLREVKTLRASGDTASGIQQKLAAKFGIRPEIAESPGTNATEDDAPRTEGRSSRALVATQHERTELAAGKIDMHFFADRFAAVERTSKRNTFALVLATAAILAGLAIGGKLLADAAGKAFGAQQKLLHDQQRQLAELARENDALRKALAASSAELNELAKLAKAGRDADAASAGQLRNLAGELGKIHQTTTAEAERRRGEDAAGREGIAAARSEIRQLSGVLSEAVSSSDSARSRELAQAMALQRKAFAQELAKLAAKQDAAARARELKLRDEFAKTQRQTLSKLLRESNASAPQK